MTLRLGTRRSPLARAQAALVADRLRTAGHDVETIDITSDGDRDRITPLAALGGTGVFVSALRDALRSGEVDLAVHSLKDLPTAPEPDLLLAAIPERDDPRDALVARDNLTLGELPTGATIATGSPRRRAQLLALGLGHDVRDIRGNVGTRLDKVTSGEFDAVVVAYAGLSRLGRRDDATEVIDPLQMLPAPGQGALAIEVRADDAGTRAALADLDDPDTRACVTAERAVLAALEAGCSAPIGALAEVMVGDDGDELHVRAVVADPDGQSQLRRSRTGPVSDAHELGVALAHDLLQDGAADLAPLAPSTSTLTDHLMPADDPHHSVHTERPGA